MKHVAVTIFLAFALSTIAQNAPETRIIVSKLSLPTYPRMALSARIAGTVELNVGVRHDGSAESVTLVKGHPLLKTAAIQSARQTVFECKNCYQPSTIYLMTYNFELGDALLCKGIDANGYGIYDESGDPQVTQSDGILNIRGRPYATCDPTSKTTALRFRSAKCLYLWRCGTRPL